MSSAISAYKQFFVLSWGLGDYREEQFSALSGGGFPEGLGDCYREAIS
jgi:hypothetical protein